jgi:hypothetical protein
MGGGLGPKRKEMDGRRSGSLEEGGGWEVVWVLCKEEGDGREVVWVLRGRRWMGGGLGPM